MPAGREADHGDLVRVDAPFLRPFPDQRHGLIEIVEGVGPDPVLPHGQMPAGREADHGDLVRVDAPFLRPFPDQRHGLIEIVEGVGPDPVLPHAVAQDKGLKPVVPIGSSHRVGLPVGTVVVSPAGQDHNGRALGRPGRTPRHLLQIALQRYIAFFVQRQHFVSHESRPLLWNAVIIVDKNGECNG